MSAKRKTGSVRDVVKRRIKIINRKIRAGEKINHLTVSAVAGWAEAFGLTSTINNLSAQDIVECCNALVDDMKLLADKISKFGTLNYEGNCTSAEMKDMVRTATHQYVSLKFLDNKLNELEEGPEKAKLKAGLVEAGKYMDEISENLGNKRFMLAASKDLLTTMDRNMVRYKPWWVSADSGSVV